MELQVRSVLKVLPVQPEQPELKALLVHQGPTGTPGTVGATGAQGVAGVTGPTGATGPAGANGTSVTIAGSVVDENALPGGLGIGDAGQGYITEDDGHLHVWGGIGWTDVGEIRGPQGVTGPQGEVGATGATGVQGATGPIGTTGSQGVPGIEGPTGATGPSGPQGVTGATGPQGVTGPAGTTSWTGITDKPTFHAVATSGDYDDLTNTPPAAINNQAAAAQLANYWIQSTNPANVAAVVQGAASQSANMLEVRDSAGLVPFAIDSTGNVTIARRTLTLNTTTTSASRMVISGNTQTNAANQYGFRNEPIFLPTGPVTNIYAFSNVPTLASSSSSVGSMFGGVIAAPKTLATYTGTLTNITGLNISAPIMEGSKAAVYYGLAIPGVATNGGNTSGTITNTQIMVGSSTAAADTGGTLHNNAVFVTMPSGSGDGTTHNKGIVISDTNASGNGVWSFYNSSAADSHISSNLLIGTTSNPNGHKVNVNGSVNATNVLAGGVDLGWVSPPATATSTGVAGQKAYDANYLYICTATNTWRRTALSSW